MAEKGVRSDDEDDAEDLGASFRSRLMEHGVAVEAGADEFVAAALQAMLGSVIESSVTGQARRPGKRGRPDDAPKASPGNGPKRAPGGLLRSGELEQAIASASTAAPAARTFAVSVEAVGKSASEASAWVQSTLAQQLRAAGGAAQCVDLRPAARMDGDRGSLSTARRLEGKAARAGEASALARQLAVLCGGVCIFRPGPLAAVAEASAMAWAGAVDVDTVARCGVAARASASLSPLLDVAAASLPDVALFVFGPEDGSDDTLAAAAEARMVEGLLERARAGHAWAVLDLSDAPAGGPVATARLAAVGAQLQSPASHASLAESGGGSDEVRASLAAIRGCGPAGAAERRALLAALAQAQRSKSAHTLVLDA